ncbi:MAG: CPBP family intramembrane metalloprotease [Spirosomaceae bacterium]|nr:CPBP family intramembrane metalloprotease [Spirosomataceae bacterium]
MSDQKKVILSPFLIIAVNILVAIITGKFIGKWAFIPIILIEWVLFAYFIRKFGKSNSIHNWLRPTKGKYGWKIAALLMGILTLPLFIFNHKLLAPWQIWLPWVILALVNPFLEEFYWRGLLLDYTASWSKWRSVLFTATIFSASHAVFGINSEINRGIETLVANFIMGVIWAIVYQKTGSLRWTIAGHFFVDFFSVSAPAFLDLFEKQSF